MRKTILIGGLVSGTAVGQGAWADSLDAIFTVQNQPSLCTASGDAGPTVSANALAISFMEASGLSWSMLDRANADRVADGEVSKDERLYAVTNEAYLGDPKWVPTEVADRLIALHGDLDLYLRHAAPDSRRGYLAKVSPELGDPATELFSESGKVQILCTEATALEQTEEKSAFAGRVLNPIRLRESKDDLLVSRDDANAFEGAGSAQVAFHSDERSDAKTFTFKGALGVHFDLPTSPTAEAAITPYAAYERRDISDDEDGDTDDKDLLALGVLGSYTWGGDYVAATGALAFEYASDFELDSDLVDASVYLHPAFAIPLNKDYTFYTDSFNNVGPLRIRPDVEFVAQASYVLDEGTNPDLASHDDYYGLGGKASIQIKIPHVALLDRLTFSLDYRWMALFSTQKDDISWLTAGVDVDLFDTPYVTFGAFYVDGEDQLTLQEENYWQATLKLKW